ncbi:MAG: hypothetical protein CMP69_01610 [Flavobacteriales bacterium]|nr:hypothetical protein [Flavobacteriales bacterium]MBO98166.1 hypothetical protein [Flavobacteriales bacterium]
MFKGRKKKKNPLRHYLKYSSLSLQMGLVIFLGVKLGVFLDGKTQFKPPVYTIATSLISIFITLYYIIQSLKK